MFYRTSQSLMRTNNSAEAYHHRINSIFQCSHPTLWVFLQKLIDEQNTTHADIRDAPVRSDWVPVGLGTGPTGYPVRLGTGPTGYPVPTG